MEYRLGKFEVTKVTRTLVHAPITGGTLKVTVIRTQAHIQQATSLGQVGGLIIRLGNLDFSNRTCFLLKKKY